MSYLRVVTDHWGEVRAGRWRLALAVASPNPAVQQVRELAVIARDQPDEAAFRVAVAQPGGPARRKPQENDLTPRPFTTGVTGLAQARR